MPCHCKLTHYETEMQIKALQISTAPAAVADPKCEVALSAQNIDKTKIRQVLGNIQGVRVRIGCGLSTGQVVSQPLNCTRCVTPIHTKQPCHWCEKCATLKHTILLLLQPCMDLPMKQEQSQAYKSHMTGHSDLSIKAFSLFIDQTAPFLGASPNALVHCTCCGNGVVEV